MPAVSVLPASMAAGFTIAAAVVLGLAVAAYRPVLRE